MSGFFAGQAQGGLATVTELAPRRGYFADQKPKPELETLEDVEEGKVPRDQWGRPLIKQADGEVLPYNRASSYGGQIEDKTNIERWRRQQVVRGMTMAPHLMNAVPKEATDDPWADLKSTTKKALTRISEQAEEIAGSNLKSELGTQIHAATEYIDLGDSLEDKLADFDPERRSLLIERANAYYAKVRELGLVYDSVETFGVQDDLHVAGTWDRRGFVPWWPEHRQRILDVKTSSSLDFAGVGFSVQLATYSRMCEYVVETGERIPHEDMGLDKALIIHVGRKRGEPVEAAEVDIEWGWRHAMLARQIIVARREGEGRVRELGEFELAILATRTRRDLEELIGNGAGIARHLLALANTHWKALAA